MPIRTMLEIFLPESSSEKSTSSRISEALSERTSPPIVEAQKAQPCRQPTWQETQTVLPCW